MGGKFPINNLEEKIIETEELIITEKDGGVCSLIETEDKRIACGNKNGSISISSYNVNTKKWNKDIYNINAHNKLVRTLCALNGNRLLSGSWDYSIKIWFISKSEMKLIKEIKEHTNSVSKVIPLSKERFASCSWDKTVRIWKDDNTYKCLSILEHSCDVISVLQLTRREILISSSSFVISFWNSNNYTKQYTIEGYSIRGSNRMIELSDGNIALSSICAPNPIVIIDSLSYQIVTMIQLKNYIVNLCFSMCTQSFIHMFLY